MNMQAFVERHKISISSKRTDRNPAMEEPEPRVRGTDYSRSPEMDHWRVTLKCGNRKFTLTFSQGAAFEGKPPEVAEVLDCLASDVRDVEGSRSFEDWAGDYGYDPDSRRALLIYIACQRAAKRLEAFLGAEDYRFLLEEVEPC